MKKRIFWLVLTAAALCGLLLCACEKEEPHNTPQGDTTQAQTTQDVQQSDTTQNTEPLLTMTVAGHDIGEYTIVYARTPYTLSQTYRMETESDFFRLCAEHIADSIEAMTGKKLPVVSERRVKPGNPYEILVGPTDREQSQKTIEDVRRYEIEVQDTFLTVMGGYRTDAYTDYVKAGYCFASTYHAWDAVEALAAECESGTIEFKAGEMLSGQAELYTVACVGDSITEGYGSTDFEGTGSVFSYPAVLGRLLWQDCLVLNYGCSATTMRNDLGYPYTTSPQYAALVPHADAFDLVFIMLGTNDSYSDYLWTADGDAAYLNAAQELVAVMRRGNPDLPVVVMNNPAYYGQADLGMGHVRVLQNTFVSLLREQDAPVAFFDMNALTQAELTAKHYPDDLHPDDYGYLQMAKAVSGVIAEIRAGTYSYTLPEIKDDRFSHRDEIPAPQINPNAVNLFGFDFGAVCPIGSCEQGIYYYGGAPYFITDQSAVSGHIITDLQFPVLCTGVGEVFTVAVYRRSDNQLVETRKLTTDFSSGSGWVTFSDLQLAVPQDCYLAFGALGDNLPVLWMAAGQPTHFFTCMPTWAVTQSCLPCNIYGIPLN